VVNSVMSTPTLASLILMAFFGSLIAMDGQPVQSDGTTTQGETEYGNKTPTEPFHVVCCKLRTKATKTRIKTYNNRQLHSG
jgi:hypothetical protein